MNKKLIQWCLVLSVCIYSCTSTRQAGSGDNRKIDVTFIQINDVYEIAPLEAGKSGGMARIATLKKESLGQNPNTFLVMAGDFLSPSVYNSLQYEGKRIRGKQMVEAMNTAGMDIAVFGNHEFDISENELQERLNESRFRWVSSNTFHNTRSVLPFVKKTSTGTVALPEYIITTVKDGDGTTARIGFLGLTLPFNKVGYVSYTDVLSTAEKIYNQIKDSCDAIVAITHQLVDDDVLLAKKLPGLAMILGGHEHDMRFQKVGNVFITKAHANAKSAYMVTLSINTRKHSLRVKPVLKMIDESIAMDPATDSVVKKWTDIADKSYAAIGFDAKKVVMQTGEPLDGREAEIRRRPTNLTRLIVAAMQKASPSADVVIINSGSVRVDDIIQMPMTQYDVIRSLPFGGGITEVDMKGSLLTQIVEAGRKNIGIGGYLHYSPDLIYNEDTKNWTLKGNLIDPVKIYKVALTDFLLTGGEANMEFLKKDNPGIVKAYPPPPGATDPRSDIRLAIIRYIESQ